MVTKNLFEIENATTEAQQAQEVFSNCLQQVTHQTFPYDYWLLRDVLPSNMIDDLMTLPFPKIAHPVFDGRRESNNSSRIYFSPENQKRHAVCRDMVGVFGNPQTIRQLEKVTKSDLSRGQLRIEYCQDEDGFWLEPHLDLGVKLFTMLIYLSDDPKLYDAGTDIYDDTPQHNLVATAPYEYNTGLFFIPGENTWHGFKKRPVRGLRKSIIVNYVSPAWRSVEELAYPARK